MTVDNIPDKRSPSLASEPYSAYCQVCWRPVYTGWIDKEPHNGNCILGHHSALDCPDAIGHHNLIAVVKNYKRKCAMLIANEMASEELSYLDEILNGEQK